MESRKIVLMKLCRTGIEMQMQRRDLWTHRGKRGWDDLRQ